MSFGPIQPRLWRRQNPTADEDGRYKGKHGLAWLWTRFDDAVIRQGNKIASIEKTKISDRMLAVGYIVIEIASVFLFAFLITEMGSLKAFGMFLLFLLGMTGVVWFSRYVSFFMRACLRLTLWNGKTLLLTVATTVVLLAALIA